MLFAANLSQTPDFEMYLLVWLEQTDFPTLRDGLLSLTLLGEGNNR